MTDFGSYSKLKKALFDMYFGSLNEMQREAVYTTEGPLLVLAGAGSGKTTVIVNRIANIVLFGRASQEESAPEGWAELVPHMEAALKSNNKEMAAEVLRKCAIEPAFPYRVLCITFTNKAAKEFKNRLQSALGRQADDIWAGTFHSVCVRILRRHIDRLGYSNDFTIYDTDDSKKLIAEVMKELNIDEKKLLPKTVINTISRCKERCQVPEDLMYDAGRDVRLIDTARVYDRYQRKLREANALDFDDIIMLTIQLFQEESDVLERYTQQFRYILVDEYQDTNPSQSRLVSLLAGDRGNVCVVGDDDQSIYSFRGATIENILGFDSDYNNTKIIRLEQNYRSTGNILTAANSIIQNNIGRKGKELWTKSSEGEKVHLKKLYTQAEEAEFICDTIAERVKKGARYSDFAVLYRVNAISNALENAFVKKRIPYKIVGGLRFYERREVKDILAYLSVMSNPADNVRLSRIINLPKRAIGGTTIEKLSEIANSEGISMFRAAETSYAYPELMRSAGKLGLFTSLIHKLRQFSLNHGLAETVSYVIEETGYRAMLAEEDNGEEREQNVLELVSTAALFEETAENPTLADFLNELALVSDVDKYQAGDNSVVLMTVHSAKGLEFPVVFIPGFEEGMFPSSQSLAEGGLEEERRLAYVAVTRAKKELFLLCTTTRMMYGRTDAKMVSRFAKEIPQSVYDASAVREKGYGMQDNAQRIRQNNADRSNYLENVRRAAQSTAKSDVIAEGSRVAHPMFGNGIVLSANPMGGDVLYEIEFENGSIKRLMGNFAKLKKL